MPLDGLVHRLGYEESLGFEWAYRQKADNYEILVDMIIQALKHMVIPTSSVSMQRPRRPYYFYPLD